MEGSAEPGRWAGRPQGTREAERGETEEGQTASRGLPCARCPPASRAPDASARPSSHMAPDRQPGLRGSATRPRGGRSCCPAPRPRGSSAGPSPAPALTSPNTEPRVGAQGWSSRQRGEEEKEQDKKTSCVCTTCDAAPGWHGGVPRQRHCPRALSNLVGEGTGVGAGSEASGQRENGEALKTPRRTARETRRGWGRAALGILCGDGEPGTWGWIPGCDTWGTRR